MIKNNKQYSIIINHPIEQVSDGYHTFGELYEHRVLLSIALGSLITKNLNVYAWKSKKHDDGSEWENWFIVGIDLPTGTITYHLPENKWNLCECFQTLEKAPTWDGHTSNDVLFRLQQFIELYCI